MRVLHILEDHENDCASRYAAEVIIGLQQIGIEQCALINKRSPRIAELEKSGVKILPLAARMPWRPSRRLWLRKIIARLQPEVTHCWSRSAVRLVPQSKMPVVGWLAGNDKPRRFTRCTHFVSTSRDAVLAGEKEIQSRYIPDFSIFSPVPPLDRMTLATAREAKVLLSLAPLHPASQLEILFGVLEKLPEVVVWFGGQGPLRRVLENKARMLGVSDRVRFVSAQINRGALLRAADLSILVAPERTSGTIIPESWAAGTPVIAVYKKGFVTPLEDGVNGLLVSNSDEEACLDTIRRGLKDDALRCRLIAKGYAAYLGTYAREAIIRQWTDFYRDVVART